MQRFASLRRLFTTHVTWITSFPFQLPGQLLSTYGNKWKVEIHHAPPRGVTWHFARNTQRTITRLKQPHYPGAVSAHTLTYTNIYCTKFVHCVYRLPPLLRVRAGLTRCGTLHVCLWNGCIFPPTSCAKANHRPVDRTDPDFFYIASAYSGICA